MDSLSPDLETQWNYEAGSKVKGKKNVVTSNTKADKALSLIYYVQKLKYMNIKKHTHEDNLSWFFVVKLLFKWGFFVGFKQFVQKCLWFFSPEDTPFVFHCIWSL